MKQICVPGINSDHKILISNLVNEIFKAKSADLNADTTDLENEIDKLVNKLYSLTPEEIHIMEEANEHSTN